METPAWAQAHCTSPEQSKPDPGLLAAEDVGHAQLGHGRLHGGHPGAARPRRIRRPARSAPPAWLAAVVAAAPLDEPPTAPATVAAVAAAAAACCCAAALRAAAAAAASCCASWMAACATSWAS